MSKLILLSMCLLLFAGNAECHFSIWAILAFLGLALTISLLFYTVKNVEAVADFIFLDSKITADSNCSHEIKMLAPWNESYDKPRQCIFF